MLSIRSPVSKNIAAQKYFSEQRVNEKQILKRGPMSQGDMRLFEITKSLSDFEKEKNEKILYINDTMSDFSKQLRS